MTTCNACEAYQQERVGLFCPDHLEGRDHCPDCGDVMSWNKEFRCYECDNCEMYVEDDRVQSDFISSEIN